MNNLSNGNFERLVEQITDVVLSKLNGTAQTECFSFCGSEEMRRMIDAGAARVGLVLGETASARDWASLIDHTLLKPEAAAADIRTLCEEAAQFGFASVCVNPFWIKTCAKILKNSGVPVCTVRSEERF